MNRVGWWVGTVGVVASLALAGTGVQAAEQAKGTLDGKVFSGEVANKGKKHGDKDNFVFRDGTFRSTACDPYGFKPTAYTAVTNGNATAFEAKAISPKEGTMMWKGTVRGSAIEGTTQWHKSNGKIQEMWFKGSLKSKS